VITPIIPPGLGFIIYGFLADVSIGCLFIAGILPGLMLPLALMLVTHFLARRHDYSRIREKRASLPRL
jgi:TRAP-type transport system large permease protein